MKKFIIVFLLAACTVPFSLRAQITNVIVEKYYISDANDATDSTNYIDNPAYPMPILPVGSTTYRVYIQLQPGSRLKKIYGDTNITWHPLVISSTQNFYNNIDRNQIYFGYQINKSWFSNNPTLALDSWLTLGLATSAHTGILKTQDSDSCISQIKNNTPGLLKNNNPNAGIPISLVDGLVPNTAPSANWSNGGFIAPDSALGVDVDTTIFGPVKSGSEFFGKNVLLQQSPGIEATVDSNKILVAQLTTLGEISFQLNAVVDVPDGASYDVINYVAAGNDTSYQDGNNAITERACPFLKYPPVCGCTDPNYLEYSSNYTCSNVDSCHTLVRLGCMDVMACNYDPTANFNLPSLCCYPGKCNDRDIAMVCPALAEKQIHIYPNPAQDEISLTVLSDNGGDALCRIYDCQGKLMLEKNISLSSGVSSLHMDVSGLAKGVYMLRVFMQDDSIGKTFFKN